MPLADPEVSIVIPILNEAENLRPLMEGLARQKDARMEVIFSDGGSGDGTPARARKLGEELSLEVDVVEGPPGRGGQLNRGAARARAKYLLFLHADSTFSDPNALRDGLSAISEESLAKGSSRVAGKFRLRFHRTEQDQQFGYYFYESKARLLRRECSHGDQGLLLPRSFFDEVGPFDQLFSMLAETRLADRVLDAGRLILLPGEIITSARRFEVEGLRQRQTVNALIMNFAAIKLHLFFRRLPDLYPAQHEARQLKVPLLLREVHRMLGELPLRERLTIWYATGSYVRRNAWQLAFACDAWRNRRRGIPPGSGMTPILDTYDRRIDRLADNPLSNIISLSLVWCWSHLSCTRLLRGRRNPHLP